MNLKLRIEKAEEKFLQENVIDPTYLIMRPEAREELKFQLGEDEGLDILDIINNELNSFNGLTVAVCFKKTFPDFFIC